MGLVEYKSREFCKDTNCEIQLKIWECKNSEELQSIKNYYCRAKCKAYEFHVWLQEKGYGIIRFENKT